jgi:hypothetical protein
MREKLIHFGYELVRAGTGELLAEGETTHIVADKQMKPRALPEKYLKVFREAIAPPKMTRTGKEVIARENGGNYKLKAES